MAPMPEAPRVLTIRTMKHAQSAAAIMEHRFGMRIPCHAPLRIDDGSGLTARGRMRNVSISGAFVETTLALPLHALLTIEVVRKDGKTDIPRTGRVVRRDADGVGIEWLETAESPICPLLGCSTLCAAASGADGCS
jgi:hypothetical protein